MNPDRLLPTWRERVRQDGRWDEPTPWPPGGLQDLPWEPEQVSRALTELRGIYRPADAKRIFRAARTIELAMTPERELTQGQELELKLERLLTDITLPLQSELLQLGIDAGLVSASSYPTLRQRLCRGAQYPGARFELSVMAALTRAGVRWSYEPRRGLPGPQPDLEVTIREHKMLLELKAVSLSDAIIRHERWWRRLLLLGADGQGFAPLLAHVELEEAVHALPESEKNVLADHIRARARELRALGSLPRSEVVDGLATILVEDPPRTSGTPSFDYAREARRVVKGVIESGAGQHSTGDPFVLLVDLGGIMQADIGLTLGEVERWMREEGSGATKLRHVLLSCVGLYKHRPVRFVLPMSRQRTPTEVLELVNSLVSGFNYILGRSGPDVLPLLTKDGDWPGAEGA